MYCIGKALLTLRYVQALPETRYAWRSPLETGQFYDPAFTALPDAAIRHELRPHQTVSRY